MAPPFEKAFRPIALPSLGRAMTRCECAGVAFSEIVRRMESEGKSLEAVMAQTGVGGTCTACVSDLTAFAARTRAAAGG